MTYKSVVPCIAIISLIIVIVLSFGFPTACAAAGDETTPVSISVIPTFECIGVTVDYSGDNNENNSAVLSYRQSGGTWQTAPEMYADRAQRQYRGSIFWLTADTQYEIRVTLNDADGGGSISETVATRDDNPPIGTNEIFVATDGSDTAGDGSIGNPYLTVAKGVSMLAEGSTLYIRGGTYNLASEVEIGTSGSSTNWVTIMAYNGENVTLTGGGTTGILFYICSKHHIRIRDINFRDCLYSAVHVISTHDTIIDSCTFYNAHTEYGIAHGDGFSSLFGSITYGGGYTYNYNHLVQNCDFDWDSGEKAVSSGIGLIRAYYGVTIRNNTFSSSAGELWDGVSTYPEDTAEAQYLLESCDVYDNTIYNCSDDGLQLEGANVNMRIWGNVITNARAGIAVCPVLKGPCYVFRNVVWCYGGSTNNGMKLGKESTGYGRLYIYHNTFVVLDGNNGITQTNSELGNVISRNNVVYASRYIIEFAHAGDGGFVNDFDYDYLYSTDSVRFVNYYGDGCRTLAQFQDKEGMELHGVSDENPGFVSAGSGNFQLQADSPCVDQGVILPGFNDASSPWPYSSNAPDMGAYEYAGGPAIDTSPPYTSGHNPGKNAADIAPDTNISVHVRDNGSGVDRDSIVMRVEGSVVTPTITGGIYDYTVTYNPPTDFDYEQVVDVTLEASDLNSNDMATESYSFTIQSEGGNQAPVAVSDYYSTDINSALSVAAPGVLGNDSDADGDSLTAVLVSDVSDGSLALSSNGSFTYTPDEDYSGSDSFSYRANDGQADSDTATVTISIASGGDDDAGDDDVGGGGGGSSGGGGGNDNMAITTVGNYVSASGKFNIAVSVPSSDGKVRLDIPQDTEGENSAGLRLTSIGIEKLTANVPSPPDDGVIVGSVYDISPDGASFEPSISLVMSYADIDIPDGVSEKNLVVGHCDEITGVWLPLPSSANLADETVTASVDGFSMYAILAFTRPASFEITDISYPDIVTCGSDIDIQVTILNAGDLTGEYEVSIMLDDEVLATETITLDGAESTTVTVSAVTDVAGLHRISIGDAEETFTAEVYEAPANFITSNINISPTEVYLGDSVEISTLVSNTGDLAGVYEATLKIDNELTDSKNLSVAGGDSEIIIFTFTPDNEGEHIINIGEKVVFFTVRSAADVETVTIDKPEISRFDVTPTYNPQTGKIESTRIDYRIINLENLDAGSRLILKVFRDGEPWEEIPLITLDQLETDQDTGYLSYVPSEGWAVGTYIFEAVLEKQNGVVHDIQFEKVTLIEESITKAVSWGALGIIIGGTLIVLLTVLAIIIYRRREMLRGYVE